tara:strand:+ start:619 stop:1053 length:435 start_codon:yes stop_codon:yes gene_type:complete
MGMYVYRRTTDTREIINEDRNGKMRIGRVQYVYKPSSFGHYDAHAQRIMTRAYNQLDESHLERYIISSDSWKETYDCPESGKSYHLVLDTWTKRGETDSEKNGLGKVFTDYDCWGDVCGAVEKQNGRYVFIDKRDIENFKEIYR